MASARLQASHPRLRRILSLIGWNALLFIAGAVLVVMAGEVYLRLTVPFMESFSTSEFVPNVGYVRTPDTEIRHTNRLDFWTVSRVNSLGFLDREPPSPERAAAGCHIAMIGDSFVEAMEVPIEDKFHVRLEALAARALPHLDVTTSAFGRSYTAQVQQLPFYDEYARHLRPKLLVLVFVPNDLRDNSPILRALELGWDPEYPPQPILERNQDGAMQLRPPHPDHEKFRLPRRPGPESRIVRAAKRKVKEVSWFASWLDARKDLLISFDPAIARATRRELLSQRPGYAALLEGWQPAPERAIESMVTGDDRPPALEEAWEYTAFAMEQFRERAERDGARLVILASHRLKLVYAEAGMFDRLGEVAAALGIPVIDQADYILRQGGRLGKAQWRHDAHWNVAGHRWAAEALLEWLKDNQETCAGTGSAPTPDRVPGKLDQ